jgi:hypothetical protein
MKAAHEFETAQDYRQYLLFYFTGQALRDVAGSHQGEAEWAVKRAEATVRALEAFIPEKNTFDY